MSSFKHFAGPVALSAALVQAALAGTTLEVPGPLNLTIQEAICIADELGATELLIEPGTYLERLRFDQDEFGGPCFDGSALTLTGSPGDPSQTVIDAQGLDSVIHIFSSTAEIVINGFTLTGGLARSSAPEDRGAGVYLNASSNVTIMNTVFQGNSAIAGGGLYANGGNVTLVDCQFLANDANNGGGLYTNQCTVSVTNCLFDQNDAAAEGGAMRVYNGSATVADSTFDDNASVTYGGALSIRFAPSFTITRSTFISNFSGEFGTGNGRGGAIYSGDGSVTSIDNSLFMDNAAIQFGGALYSGFPMTVLNCSFAGNVASTGTNSVLGGNIPTTMTNCIVWGNIGPTPVNGNAIVRYSICQGGFAGPGNIDADPMFTLELTMAVLPGSPAVDAGDTTALQGQYPVDRWGQLRAVDDPSAPDTGLPFLNLAVDMGANELQPELVVSCPSDISGDGLVGIDDFLALLAAWGQCP